MALSDDLRERFVGAVVEGACRTQAIWGQHRQRRALGGALGNSRRNRPTRRVGESQCRLARLILFRADVSL